MNKQVDMQAFVGVDFDCEFAENPLAFGNCGLLTKITEGALRPYEMRSRYRQRFCRPRLERLHVLDKWEWIPNGLVWANCDGDQYTSKQLKDHINAYSHEGIYECIGAEPDYKEWADANGVPVVEVGK